MVYSINEKWMRKTIWRSLHSPMLSGRTGPDNGVSRTPIFLVNCPLIFRSLSGPNSGRKMTGQFVRRTFRLDSPLDMTGQNTKLSRQGPDKDRNYHCYCY